MHCSESTAIRGVHRDSDGKTLAAWCGRNVAYSGRRYSTILIPRDSRRAPAPAGGAGGRPHRLTRRSTASTQLCDPAKTQGILHRQLPAFRQVADEGAPWPPRRIARLTMSPQGSDSVESPRSISNSSLRELEEEYTGEELATYMLQVNKVIGAQEEPI
ncbi:hypothetical protein EVAR_13534_1 [Eumeta japonica]|uniref:Uncharacterized protein n=1 Tax=Eumeta variegata TaxID=151549 RepID=A0A4C1UA29_EUMVA|nr:hypothetical protein EVAR_13534_1 [Eumeta japonica]